MDEAMSEERLAACRDLPQIIRRHTWTAAEDAADAIRDLTAEVDRLRTGPAVKFDLRTQLEALARDVQDTTHGEMFISFPDSDAVPMAKFLEDLLSSLELQNPKAGLAEHMRHQPTGVYRLFWHSGGCSVAAVGMLDDGSRWYAPANWTSSGADGVASADWSPVKSAELIESHQGSRRKRPRKVAPNV